MKHPAALETFRPELSRMEGDAAAGDPGSDDQYPAFSRAGYRFRHV